MLPSLEIGAKYCTMLTVSAKLSKTLHYAMLHIIEKLWTILHYATCHWGYVQNEYNFWQLKALHFVKTLITTKGNKLLIEYGLNFIALKTF